MEGHGSVPKLAPRPTTGTRTPQLPGGKGTHMLKGEAGFRSLMKTLRKEQDVKPGSTAEQDEYP